MLFLNNSDTHSTHKQ